MPEGLYEPRRGIVIDPQDLYGPICPPCLQGAHTGCLGDPEAQPCNCPVDHEVEPLVQTMAETAHEAWVLAQLAEGTTSRKAAWGEEFMVPFDELSERGREFDRVIMRAILKTFARFDLQVVPRPTPTT